MRWMFLLCRMLLLAAPAHSASILSVGDRDTITVIEGSRRIKVRLACIGAPETSQSPYGMEARRALQALLPIRSLVPLKTKATDRYGRSVAKVLKGSTNINQSLVESGDAFVYWRYISGCDRQTYSLLENDARLKGAGVWSMPGGIQRPWDYRRGRRGGVVRHQAVVPPAVAEIAAGKSNLGAERRTYSGKDTPTLTVMVMGRRVKR